MLADSVCRSRNCITFEHARIHSCFVFQLASLELRRVMLCKFLNFYHASAIKVSSEPWNEAMISEASMWKIHKAD